MWDIYICHADADKDSIARPLAEALTEESYKVWYDEHVLTLGDSLYRSAQHGLVNSRFAVVILSPNFFASEGPKQELTGLATKELGSGKIILPIWHNITRSDIGKFSLALADKHGISTSLGLDRVVKEVVRAIHAAAQGITIDRISEPKGVQIDTPQLLGVHRINKGVFDANTCNNIDKAESLLVGTNSFFGIGVYAYYINWVPDTFRGDPLVIFQPMYNHSNLTVKNICIQGGKYAKDSYFFVIPGEL